LPSIGTELPHSVLVPSLSFLPTSTVYSASTPCGSVAPRSRPWGSPRFEPRSPSCRNRASNDALPSGATPFGAFPPTTAVPCHHGLLPSRRCDGLGQPLRRMHIATDAGPTSRPQGFPPQPDPLHAARRFRRVAARCSLGLRSQRGSRSRCASLQGAVRVDAQRTGAFAGLRTRRGLGRAVALRCLRNPSRCVGFRSPLISTIVPHCGATSRGA
jgi:hypothetical protein